MLGNIKFYLLYLVSVLVFVTGSLEILLRIYLSYNPSYYTGFRIEDAGTQRIMPYGVIKINSLGYPDDEFEQHKKLPRIGYIGDSVCVGVGAGYGFRLTELLENKYPEFEHLNLAFVGAGITNDSAGEVLKLAKRFQLNEIIYLLNLNDIAPDESDKNLDDKLWIAGLRGKFDWLRGKSYLYTAIRTVVKQYYVRQGYEASGHLAYELFPERYASMVRATATRVTRLYQELKKRDVIFKVVLLPYEMQISSPAEKTYSDFGIKWDKTFIDRGPQKILLDTLENLPVTDAYYAFVDKGDPMGSRAGIDVGEFFVYNLGDKLDWNHPNRKGHAKIAKFLIDSGFVDLPKNTKN